MTLFNFTMSLNSSFTLDRAFTDPTYWCAAKLAGQVLTLDGPNRVLLTGMSTDMMATAPALLACTMGDCCRRVRQWPLPLSQTHMPELTLVLVVPAFYVPPAGPVMPPGVKRTLTLTQVSSR